MTRRIAINHKTPALKLVWCAPETPVPPRTAQLDFLVTCPRCGTTRLVTAKQVRTGTWQRCPHCCGGSEAA
jgi:transcription elongation factor Elf1